MAAEDPFLADALSGLRSFPEEGHQARLSRLRGKARIKRRAYVGRWAAAAAIILLTGIGLWWFQPGTPAPADAAIARQSESEEAKSAEQYKAPKASSAATDSVIVRAEEKRAAAKPPPAAPRPAQSAADTPALAAEESDEAATEAEAAPPSPSSGYAMAEAETIQPETIPQADEAALGRAAEPSPPALSEAPADQQAYIHRQVRAKAAPAVTAEPVTGWPAFEAYLQAAWPATDTTAQQVRPDTFQVVFRISDGGRPGEIQITASTAPRLNRKVKRLLRDGPLWQPGGASATHTLILPAN